ncbi:MAG: TIGR00266 family protein [Solirubrobacteraceae bacterium]
MNLAIRHNPSFAVVRAEIGAGEQISVEAGAMMAMAAGVQLESKMEGGLKKGLMRSVLGGESLFVTKLTGSKDGDWVDAAARLPGDLQVLDVNGSLNLTSGAWLLNDGGVTIDTKWGGFKNLMGGEGGFLIKANGTGKVVVSCYGAMETYEVAAGEQLVLDSGHLVAYEDSLTLTTRTVTKGIMGAIKSGEGLVFEFTGPGKVWAQTRNPGELISWLTSELPFSRD